MAFTPFVESDQPTMAAFNEKFRELIAEAVGQAPKIEMGSYVGTGTSGKENPVCLTFNFVPKLIAIGAFKSSSPSLIPAVNGQRVTHIAHGGTSGLDYMYWTWDEKTAFFYPSGSGSLFNVAGESYCYIGIG
ncbi:hypothetical protein [uncultured Dysosmobacter sp.]|uniref:hypothetical protein n=1 Tax=uncultured Dysosmobacter sp. TaxID=2591384 RepID=UPI0026366728|nr:hypothetical protein [uncultured Dysosmobacter sp.]